VDKLTYRGGSRIGWINASWPFGKLSLSKDLISISGMEKIEFTPSQVVSFERYWSIPLFANGIQIKHNRLDIPEKVIFWCVGSRESVLLAINQIGFEPTGQSIPRAEGFPVRWHVVIAMIVLWNALFMIDQSFESNEPNTLGSFSLLALFLLFSFATVLLKSKRLQNIVLRSGHQLGEIKSILLLLQIVSGFLFLGFGMNFLFFNK
jgi:hypothetical protein